jgi:hypothetical protein
MSPKIFKCQYLIFLSSKVAEIALLAELRAPLAGRKK